MILVLRNLVMTPLRDFIGSICPPLPGLIPYFFAAWVMAIAWAFARLAIDEHHGDRHTMLSAVPFALWLGSALTLSSSCSRPATRDCSLTTRLPAG